MSRTVGSRLRPALLLVRQHLAVGARRFAAGARRSAARARPRSRAAWGRLGRLWVGARALAALALVAFAVTLAGVTVVSMFTGDTSSRALGAAVAGVALSLLTIFNNRFGELFSWLAGSEFTRRHGVVLALILLLFAPLGLTQKAWLPGVLDRCYTVPGSPTGNARTHFVRAPDGECYGLVDSAGAGFLAPGSFGRNDVADRLQRQLLAGNRPLRDGDLTVVWLGSLSCTPLPGDSTRCADERDYPAERDQLRALLLTQAHYASRPGHARLHVVIGNAGQDVRHIDDVASLIIDHRADFGGRLAVVGGGDSRDITQRAINRLLDHGIPFIAPNLLADLGGPGRPFVQRPGYLQLPPPNEAYAEDAVRRLRKTYPQGFRMEVYQVPAPTDQYTTSLLNDLLSAASRTDDGGRVAARHVRDLAQITATVCGASDTDGTTDGTGAASDRRPTVVFFADRWTRFGAFIHRINEVCAFDPPRQVLADGSVARFMASARLRAQSNATWPLGYYVGGLGCGSLDPLGAPALTPDLVNRTLDPRGGHYACGSSVDSADGPAGYCALDAAEDVSQPCRPNDLGGFLAPAHDAIALAEALLPPRRSADVPADPAGGAAYLKRLSLAAPVRLSQGLAMVRGGNLDQPTIPLQMWTVGQLDNPAEAPRIAEPGEG